MELRNLLDRLSWWYRTRFQPFLFNLIDNPYKEERKCLPRFSWKDRDVVMVDVVFKLFTEYLERENPHWDTPPRRSESWTEMDEEYKKEVAEPLRKKYEEIYSFIKLDYPKLLKRYDENEISDDELYEKETEYLIKIINIRGSLWT